MTDLRTAAQLALEALEGGGDSWRLVGPAIDALKAALEQPGQEPVAWMVYTEDGKSAYVTDNPHDLVGAYKAFALYTHPPRREWRGLSEEEMKSTCADAWSYDPYVIARDIEAKLKELNHE
jgi:hypothetical protein